ncbi:MAG: AAA family ATPase [Magnetococcales bacterium]|nr:AAA family ATPase [Magnetococcales bacterium]
MLEQLTLTNVGPAPRIDLKFGERLNLLTGDNGLGKSFLLDVAWWALTNKWPAEVNPWLTSGRMARPSGHGEATIDFSFTGQSKRVDYSSRFDRSNQKWIGRWGRPAIPGLVLYAQGDGSFALWDPARNFWRTQGRADIQERPAAYVFTPREVWDGLRDPHGQQLCNGLIHDWAGWQKEKGEAFDNLQKTLASLSPDPAEVIAPGPLTRISLDDVRDIPTLAMPYGQNVPLLHASAGMRRIIALGYLLTWAWQEHIQACKLLDQPMAHQLIFLVDEIEAHLHPKWQRRIIRALLGIMASMSQQAGAAGARIQLIAATHSPLILASVEPFFDPERDAWFDIDLIPRPGEPSQVRITREEFMCRGEVSDWLTSHAFDLGSGRSLEAEAALAKAAELMSREAVREDEPRILHEELQRVLGDIDPFWINWRFIARKKGWTL